jgi:hypothetical protein
MRARTSSCIGVGYLPLIERRRSLEGTMTSLKKIIIGAAVSGIMASTIAADSPAAAWGYYRGPRAGAIVGAVVGGMALGAVAGAVANEARYRGGYSYQVTVYDSWGNFRGYWSAP